MTSSFIIFSHLNLKCDNNRITSEWLNHRLDLLEATAVRSLSRQTDKDFIYVVAYAVDTPRDFRRRLKRMCLNNMVLLPVAPEQTNYPCKNSATLLGDKGTALLRPFVEPDKHGMVWTHHLGTDDALARHFVGKTKSIYDFNHYQYHGYLSYSQGYACYTRTMEFHRVQDNEYFFLTLREPVSTFRSVLYEEHSRTHRRAPVIHLPSKGPMWLKTIHENQIGNYSQWRRAWKKKRLDNSLTGVRRVKKEFDLDIEGIKPCS